MFQNNLVNVSGLDRLELKPERVQEAIARELGWAERKGVRGIHRTREFADHIEAEHFVAFASKIAGRRRQPMTIQQAGRKVTITLKGLPGRGFKSGLNENVFALAVALG